MRVRFPSLAQRMLLLEARPFREEELTGSLASSLVAVVAGQRKPLLELKVKKFCHIVSNYYLYLNFGA